MLKNFVRPKKKQNVGKIVNSGDAKSIQSIIDAACSKENSRIHEKDHSSQKRRSLTDITNEAHSELDSSFIKSVSIEEQTFEGPTEILDSSTMTDCSDKDSKYIFRKNSDILDESDFSNMSKRPFNTEDSDVFFLSSDISDYKNKRIDINSNKMKNYTQSSNINLNDTGIMINNLNQAHKISTIDLDKQLVHMTDKSTKVSVANSNEKLLIPQNNKLRHSKTHLMDLAIENMTSNPISKVADQRFIKVMNLATRNIDIPYSSINSALYLPNNFKRISELYKIIDTIYKFNQNRNLELIFVKYKESIERLFKSRVEITYLEQLNFLLDKKIKFTKVTLRDEGKEIESFNIKIVESVNIDEILFNYYIERYGEWLEDQGIEAKAVRILNEFKSTVVELPRKPFLHDSDQKEPTNNMDIKNIAKLKAESIYERIKEKERQRKELFIKAQSVKIDYTEKLESIFLVSQKKAIKISDLEFKIGGLNSRIYILEACRDKFSLKIIEGEEYIVKK